MNQFTDGCKVVYAIHRLDLEAPVVVLVRSAASELNHGPNHGRSREVRNIEAFDDAWKFGKIERFLHCPELISIPKKADLHVFLGQIKELFFFTSFGER